MDMRKHSIMNKVIWYILSKYNYQQGQYTLEYSDTSVVVRLLPKIMHILVSNKMGGYQSTYYYDNDAAISLLTHAYKNELNKAAI